MSITIHFDKIIRRAIILIYLNIILIVSQKLTHSTSNETKFFHATKPKLSMDKYSGPSDDISKHRAWKYLNDEECGMSNTDKIIGGVDATLGQYPWITLLGYEQRNETVYHCGGALINHWYVITAGHCIVTDERSLKFVRLGEYNLNTDIDCFNNVCMSPVQDISIAKIIRHKYYNRPRFSNDIALLRLSHEAVYNGWVSPICLPHKPIKFTRKDIAEVGGWGIINMETMQQATILQTLKVPILNIKVCMKIYKKIAINERNICAGGQVGKDSCGGDSGGPLMKVDVISDTPKYYLIGIVSFGPTKCGSRAPGVYVNVDKYLKWILDNIDK